MPSFTSNNVDKESIVPYVRGLPRKGPSGSREPFTEYLINVRKNVLSGSLKRAEFVGKWSMCSTIRFILRRDEWARARRYLFYSWKISGGKTFGNCWGGTNFLIDIFILIISKGDKW